MSPASTTSRDDSYDLYGPFNLYDLYDLYDPRIVARNSPVHPSNSRPTNGFPPTFAVFGRGTRSWWAAGLMTVPG